MDWKKDHNNHWTIEQDRFLGAVYKDGTFKSKQTKYAARLTNKHTNELLFYTACHTVQVAKEEIEKAIEFRTNK